MQYYIKAFKKYAVFSGRAHRAEFWYFVLFTIIVSFAFSLIDSALGTKTGGSASVGLFEGLYSLVALVPSLSVGARRLHDIDKSGWWQLLWFFIIIGWIWLIVLFVKQGQEGANQYGENSQQMTTVEPVVERQSEQQGL